MIFTVPELSRLTVILAVVMVAGGFVLLASLWQVERESKARDTALGTQGNRLVGELGRIDADVDVLWSTVRQARQGLLLWALDGQQAAPDAPTQPIELPPDDGGPPTMPSHPVDMWARQQLLLAQPARSSEWVESALEEIRARTAQRVAVTASANLEPARRGAGEEQAVEPQTTEEN